MYVNTGSNRRGPSEFDIELMSAPQTSILHYVFRWNKSRGDYDLSSYNPALSNNVVTINDVHRMVQEMKALRTYSPLPHKWVGFFIFFLFIACFITIALLSKSGVNSGEVMMIMFLSMFIIFFGLSCCLAQRAKKYRERRDRDMNMLFQRLQATIFAGKNCFLRMSPYGSYFVIEFNFKLNQAQGGFPQYPAAQAGMPFYPAQPAYTQGGYPQPNQYPPAPYHPPAFASQPTPFDH